MKDLLVHFSGLNKKQQEKFDELLENFFEEEMCDGKSKASYRMITLSGAMPLTSGEIVEKFYAAMCKLDTPKRGELRRILIQLLP